MGAVAVLAVGCGDDDGIVRFDDDAGMHDGGRRDAGRVDAGAMDGGSDEDGGPPPPRDAGPMPACTATEDVAIFAPAYAAERDDADPDAFAPLGPDGPYALAYRSAEGAGMARTMRAHVVVADTAGTVIGTATLDSVTGDRTRMTTVEVAAAPGGVQAVWSIEDTDDMARVIAARLRQGAVAADGSVSRAGALFRDMSTSPFLAEVAGEGPYLLWSDLVMVGGMTGVVPRIVQLDATGAPVGMDANLMAFLRVEAQDVNVRDGAGGPIVAYRIPPSTAVVLPLGEGGAPRAGEQRHTGVPRLDDVATSGDAIALVSTDTGDTGRVEVLVVDAVGRLRARQVLAMMEPGGAEVRAAVVAAWPGFVVAWRSGSGPTAMLRGAGVTLDGAVLVPATDLVAIPESAGDLFLTASAATLVAASRTTAETVDHLMLATTCLPGT